MEKEDTKPEDNKEQQEDGAKETNGRRRLVWIIVLLAVVAAVILVFAIRHFGLAGGGSHSSSTAREVDAFTACLGSEFSQNDEGGDAGGYWFYLGEDLCETGVEYARAVGDFSGTVVFAGEDEVTTFQWICDEDGATADDADALAEEICTVYGSYTEVGGAYYWYPDEKGNMGENTDAAWVCCGVDDDGALYISGEAK